MVALVAIAPFVAYPFFVMQALCFALFACAFNLLIGYVNLLSLGHAMFLGSGELCLRPCGEGLGPRAGFGDPDRHARLGGAWSRHRRAVDPVERHLFRDDHGRLLADDLFPRRRASLHAWRGRHSGRAAGQGARRPGPVEPVDSLCFCGGRVPVRLSRRAAHRQFALRRNPQGHPGKRAARHLARLSRDAVQARSPSPSRRRLRASQARPRRS